MGIFFQLNQNVTTYCLVFMYIPCEVVLKSKYEKKIDKNYSVLRFGFIGKNMHHSHSKWPVM